MNIDSTQYQAAFLHALRMGDEFDARGAIKAARAAGVEPSDIYLHIFTPSMVTIGELWEQNQISVAEEHLATAITERLIGELSSAFARAGVLEAPGTVLIGCVAGERHALGARMLSDLFRRQDWRVLYLGADVPTLDWVTLAVRYNADAVAISAGMTYFLPEVQNLIASVRDALPTITVLVGGAAFAHAPELWRALEGCLYHPDPIAAVTLATARLRAAAPTLEPSKRAEH